MSPHGRPTARSARLRPDLRLDPHRGRRVPPRGMIAATTSSVMEPTRRPVGRVLSRARVVGHKERVSRPADPSPSPPADAESKASSISPRGANQKCNVISPLIVFDWDDTMLASSWIQSRDLLQATSYDELPADVRQDLANLEQR